MRTAVVKTNPAYPGMAERDLGTISFEDFEGEDPDAAVVDATGLMKDQMDVVKTYKDFVLRVVGNRGTVVYKWEGEEDPDPALDEGRSKLRSAIRRVEKGSRGRTDC